VAGFCAGSKASFAIAASVDASDFEGDEVAELNVANIDCAVRMGLGLVLIALASRGAIGYWGYLGIVLVATGLVALCPRYTLFGLGTTPR
jgi:hypothetical protein